MKMWLIIMFTTLLVTGLSLIYLAGRVSIFDFISSSDLPKWRRWLRGFLLVLLIFVIVAKLLNPVNAIVCTFYFALIWLICDLIFIAAKKYFALEYNGYYAGYVAIGASILALAVGWYLNHNVWQTNYTIYSNKMNQPLRIAMFADSHVGTTFKADGFAKHLQTIEAQHPDVVIISGDFVDDDTKKDDMIAACKALGEIKSKYGVYFVWGNHDEGYYGRKYRGYSGFELADELKKNGVVILADEAKLIDNRFYILGRKDASADKEHRGGRYKMVDLVKPLDKSKYVIVADHQPNDFDNQAEAEVDLVLSGHTHGGQLFPLNYVGKWIGANDKTYGHERRNKTDFIVTSGISDWTMKFKTGTKSEFVIIDIEPENK